MLFAACPTAVMCWAFILLLWRAWGRPTVKVRAESRVEPWDLFSAPDDALTLPVFRTVTANCSKSHSGVQCDHSSSTEESALQLYVCCCDTQTRRSSKPVRGMLHDHEQRKKKHASEELEYDALIILDE